MEQWIEGGGDGYDVRGTWSKCKFHAFYKKLIGFEDLPWSLDDKSGFPVIVGWVVYWIQIFDGLEGTLSMQCQNVRSARAQRITSMSMVTRRINGLHPLSSHDTHSFLFRLLICTRDNSGVGVHGRETYAILQLPAQLTIVLASTYSWTFHASSQPSALRSHPPLTCP